MMGRVVYTIDEGPRPKIGGRQICRQRGHSGPRSGPCHQNQKAKIPVIFKNYYNVDQLEKDTQKLLEIYQKKVPPGCTGSKAT